MTEDVVVLNIDDPDYPKLLKEIHDPPTPLYVRGNIEVLQQPHLLAVVGSRKNTHYGRITAETILKPTIKAGVVLVSGFARGIDTLAHRLCLEQHAPTIAVVGSGVADKVVYPGANRTLIPEIIKNGGALISEYPPLTKAQQYHFPARNRIIAGLTKATLVIQAARKSGSLITARLAVDTNREVCAIPGPINEPLAEGTNDLIKQGAYVITTATDLLSLFGLTEPALKVEDPAQLSLEQAAILKHLSTEPQHVDNIIGLTQLPAPLVSGLLLELELLQLIENIGGMQYIRK